MFFSRWKKSTIGFNYRALSGLKKGVQIFSVKMEERSGKKTKAAYWIAC